MLPAPEHLAFYAGVGAMALFGIIELPVVAALVVGHTLVNAQHNKVLQSLGEALEEAKLQWITSRRWHFS
ncbi:hypothetical protein A5697_15320 [Mycobacterium sp. E3251]|uniref:hypothetical protein n=1 Tax=Mycobacterium sp. E3251 TaxID=1834144 RepID=UPI0007FB96B5|nr:hypothetical protein [Mycobacterium sp. E3251]OBG98872.1 hypothetical protein A5697_15320 [Mycobacterium sp. E3251]